MSEGDKNVDAAAVDSAEADDDASARQNDDDGSANDGGAEALFGAAGRKSALWVATRELRTESSEIPVHCSNSPAPTVGGPFHPVMGYGGGVVLHSSTSVRRLLGIELWALQGGDPRVWAELAAGREEEQNVEPTGSCKEALLRGMPTAQGEAATSLRRQASATALLCPRGGGCPAR